MLLFIILILVIIIGVIIFACDVNFWETEYVAAIGTFFITLGGFLTLLASLVLILTLLTAPREQAKYEEYYNKLLYKVEHIDSFNKEEIITQVNQWNEDYRENTYGKKSPWNGVFYTIDTSTTNLIELENVNGN